MKRATLFLIMITALHLGAQTSPKRSPVPAASGTASCSFYAKSHDGHITAGGQKFNSNSMTAAHRAYAMGTKLKVTNVANEKSVVVTVNDRGPFVKGRELSVTRRAARELGFIRQGVANVRIEQVQ